MGLGDLKGSCWQVTFPTAPSLCFLRCTSPCPRPHLPSQDQHYLALPQTCLLPSSMLTLRTQGHQPHLDAENIHWEAQLVWLRGTLSLGRESQLGWQQMQEKMFMQTAVLEMATLGL